MSEAEPNSFQGRKMIMHRSRTYTEMQSITSHHYLDPVGTNGSSWGVVTKEHELRRL